MSEKFSARNPYPIASPLRSNTFVVRANGSKTTPTPTGTTSKRMGGKKTGDKIAEERKTESKNYREIAAEEFSTKTPALNLTLVGSPAPRSQVRALISSTSLNAAKSKGTTRHSQGSSKLREPLNPHENSMEKLYQFADNPTKFVRSENRDISELKLDLELSERSDEPEDYYDSHNIAFGANGEYRIPEYDHIRFLQFSVGESQEPLKAISVGDRESSDSLKFHRLTKTCTKSPDEVDTNGCNIATEDRASAIEIPGPLPTEDSVNDFSETGAPIAEFGPWNSKAIFTLNRSGNSPVGDVGQTYPLGSAINYKNNINPEVEKFMLDLGPECSGSEEKFARSMAGNRLLDGSILSKNFTGEVGLQPLEESTENLSRSSPRTSRTTLSQASSSDGTWHGHSLNSPYFASKESNSGSDSKRNGDPELPQIIPGYEEQDEYLTIVKNERDSGPSYEDVQGIQRYIFITDQLVRTPNSHDRTSSESFVTESTKNHSIGKIERLSSLEICNPADKEKDHDSSTSDYCISKIFPHSSSSSSSSSSSTPSSSSSSSSSSSVHAKQTLKFEQWAPHVSLGHKTEGKNHCDDIIPVMKLISTKLEESNSVKDSSGSNVLYMTLDEVNLAADYTTKLSQIFNQVLKRSES